MEVKSLHDLEAIKNAFLESDSQYTYTAHVCYAAGCISSGCRKVKEALVDTLETENLQDMVKVKSTGCMGACSLGPLLVINPGQTLYCHLTPEVIPEIVRQHLIEGKIAGQYCYKEEGAQNPTPVLSDIDFFKHQKKIVLKNSGVIDFSSIEEYIANDGYHALHKVLTSMTPVAVIDEIKRAGLRGRGGGGFPTGVKWEMAFREHADSKYLICNADEGDPGAFMDRSILEGEAHLVIEGMVIGGYAIGAAKGVVYIRAEYPVAVERLTKAIEVAHEYGMLGENIFDTDFNFDIEIRIGAGAFVCGEETALMASVEGRRGEPMQKPPYPTHRGLFGKPTVINNVETLGNIVPIILNGAEWFASVGTENSKGTKIFALAGDINIKGLIEVPMGITLNDIVYKIGGGIADGKQFKIAQTGGPSGGCLPAALLDTPVDYDSLARHGAIMGSGGLICAGENTCMVDMARFFMDFVQDESCGKCTPCRVGTKRMLEILERITRGEGHEGDVETLEELGTVIKDTSTCGLGQTAPNPVLSSIRFFRDEYDEHIHDKYCRSGICYK